MRLNNSIFEKFHFSEPLTSFVKKHISLSTRKKIKSYLGKYLVPAVEIIPPEILQEWQNYSQKRSSDNLDIIEFGLISWDFRFQRPQQLAIELANLGHRVFYIEHEFISHPHPNDIFAPIQVKKVATNVYQIVISASRELFIYQEKPSTDDLKIIFASIKNLIYQAKIINPVAKIDHPFWACIINKIAMPIVYDCMDNHQGFSDSSSNLPQLEKQLITTSDLTITTSDYLQRQATDYGAKKVISIKNAADWKHFSKNFKSTPSLLIKIPHPIIGYHGGLSHWFDTNILESSLKRFPRASFVLIGKIENQKLIELSKHYSNLHLLGEIPYLQINQYVSCFDVAIIPFIINKLTKAVHPVKIFEYFAANKPVVSTCLPELKPYSSHLYFGNHRNFNSQILSALKEKRDSKRLDIAKQNTWSIKARELNKGLKSLYPKTSVIILSYNHPDLMKKTIDSVLKNSFYPNLEIIIVDNNSDEPTVKLLKRYQNISNIKIIFNPHNDGFAEGNNIGLRAATGDILVLLNNDTVVTPGWLSRLVYYCLRERVGTVGPITNSIGNEAKVELPYNIDCPKQFYNISRHYTSQHWGQTLEVHNIAAFCLAMSRSSYLKVGELDKLFGRGMFEDDDYSLRVKKYGLKIIITDDVYIHHFGGASFKQLQSEEYQRLFNENKYKFEKKWHQKWIPHQYRK